MVNPGYKQTEIGVIPEDWDDIKIEDVAKICMCKRIFAEQTSETGEIPFYKIGTFGKEADAYISRSLYDEYKARFSYPQRGDVLLSAAGTLGRTVVFDGKDAYFQDSNIVWLKINKDRLCNEYLKHYYSVIQWGSSEGSTIARLYNAIIYNSKIALPSLPEQHNIAKAIDDTDDLINSLKKSITKKKAIKQGVMQELLTGKKRLEGFPGEWKKKSINDLCWLVTKQTGFDYTAYIKPSLSKNRLHSHIPFVQNKDFEGTKINYKTDFYIPVCVAEQFPNIRLIKPCLLISLSGRIGNVGYYDGSCDAFIGGAIGIAHFNDSLIAQWATRYLMSDDGQTTIFKNEKAGAQHNLTVEDVRKFEIPIPPKEELTTILEMLNSFDSEIETLEQKLLKAQQLKQGMMQQLLTGKIRLV